MHHSFPLNCLCINFLSELFSMKMYIGSCKSIWLLCLYVLLSCIICFHVFTPVCFHPISNVQIVRTFKNRIPIKTFKKWHNVSSRYDSSVKSETANIWITSAWFSKTFGESVEENNIYDQVEPSATIKTGTVYRGCNVCYQVFLENGKIDIKGKIWNKFSNKIFFFY